MARTGLLLSFAVLLAAFELGSCLRCLQCNSQNDRDCMDPINNNNGRNIVDCNTQDSVNYNRVYLRDILPSHLVEVVAGAPRYCAKIVLHTGTTVRTCLEANPNDLNQSCRALEREASEFHLAQRQVKHCSVCDRDICNGSAAISASVPLAFLALIASYLYYSQ